MKTSVQLSRSKEEEEKPLTGENLLFVVGCPRSGTTWVQRLLACHPQIHTGQETHLFDHYIGPVFDKWRLSLAGDPFKRGIGLASYLTTGEFHQVMRSFVQSLLQPMLSSLEPGQIFLEKTPSHGLYISEIIELFPKSRFIHVLRDPRDVVASMLAASRSWGADWAPKDSHSAIELWLKVLWYLRRSSQNLPAWQFHEVRYEQLLENTQDELRKCAEFLGLEWDDDEIAKAIAINTAGAARGGSPIPLGGELAKTLGDVVREPKEFIRKAKAGSWKTELTMKDRFWIWRTSRKEMAREGYPWRFLFLR